METTETGGNGWQGQRVKGRRVPKGPSHHCWLCRCRRPWRAQSSVLKPWLSYKKPLCL